MPMTKYAVNNNAKFNKFTFHVNFLHYMINYVKMFAIFYQNSVFEVSDKFYIVIIIILASCAVSRYPCVWNEYFWGILDMKTWFILMPYYQSLLIYAHLSL